MIDELCDESPWRSAPKPLCAAEDSQQTTVLLGEDCLSTWPRGGSCEFRSPVVCWLSRESRLPAAGWAGMGGKPGSPFLGLLSFGDAKESNPLSGGHRRS